jgi:thioester reductase-like protein
MNHLADYAFLKEVNVGGLKELLRFASTVRNKSMEYISTTDVLTNLSAGAITEDAPLEEQEHFKSDGYASTKYVAEEICLLAQQRGLEVNIYRLGLITGDTVTGKNDSSQWFQQLLEASMKLKGLFSIQGFEIPITPVDFVARAIVALSYAKERNKIYHLSNDVKTALSALLEMYNDGEEKLDHLSLYEFIQRLKQYNATHEPLAVTTFFEKYLEAEDAVLEALQSQEREVKEIATARTMKDLKAENIVFPTIDKTLVKKYFDASVG